MEEKIKALANYFKVAENSIHQIDEDEYETSGGSYLVVDEDGAREYAKQDIENFIDDLGIGGFTEDFQQWILENALDKGWFEDAMRESYESYVEDIESENDFGSKYANRLIEELVDEEIVGEDELEEDEDGLLTFKDGVDIDEKREQYVDRLCDGWPDAYEWYVMNFGKDSLKDIQDQVSLDYDAIVDEAIDWDGVAHFIAYYDGKEIDLGDGLYAYRVN